jgi:signal transduction histidine kinase/ActR/RegA family two-component response regulator
MTSSLVLFIAVALLVTLLVRHLRQQTRVERNARTETERQLRQADRLQQITAALSRARTSSEVITASLPELMHVTEARAGAVFVVADDGNGLELAHAVGYASPRAASEAPVPDALRSRDLTSHEREVAIPLIAAGRPIGVVVLGFPAAARVDADEREFLLSAGLHTARGLDRARLYEAANRARADAEALRALADVELRERQKAEEALRLSEARYRTLAARTSRLYALSAGLSEAVTLDAVAKVTVRHGKVVAGASASSVALLVEGGTNFETLGGEEPDALAIDSPRVFPAEPGLCATAAVETRRPIFVGSFAEWQERYPRSASIAADGGFASTAALPLVADGAVFAVLSFHFTAPVNFDEEYTALLTSVAQHCAQALDRARSYETAERARADAEAANRSKDDFLSTISHELRTPLNAMLGWAAMLRSGAVDASRTQRAIEAIFTNATRQGRLIEELLDVSRIVAGRASFDLQNVDLGENIRGAVEAMMPLAAAKGVDVRFGPTPFAHVVADPRRLEQVFLNLFSNAVKFTPSGGHIAIDVTVSDHTAQISVTDTGAGIAPAFLPHVFERFRQADSATTRNAGGLGLGLFIARQLVEAQGGAIRVASEGTGRGATFTVTLPVAATTVATNTAAATIAADPAPTEPLPILNGIRVLVVDDEPDTREVMASALEICGATVLSAASAGAALDVLAKNQVDLLLADIAMPGQDGYELIREIRTMPSALSAIPAAAVTAHARDDERERALAAGFQMHLAKPVEPVALARAVATLVSEKGTPCSN